MHGAAQYGILRYNVTATSHAFKNPMCRSYECALFAFICAGVVVSAAIGAAPPSAFLQSTVERQFDASTDMSQAGGLLQHKAAGFWWAAAPPEEQSKARRHIPDWHPQFGDRKQEAAIIGFDMNEKALRRRLDACLLTDAEMRGGAGSWRNLPDPFPRWAVHNSEESVA